MLLRPSKCEDQASAQSTLVRLSVYCLYGLNCIHDALVLRYDRQDSMSTIGMHGSRAKMCLQYRQHYKTLVPLH